MNTNSNKTGWRHAAEQTQQELDRARRWCLAGWGLCAVLLIVVGVGVSFSIDRIGYLTGQAETLSAQLEQARADIAAAEGRTAGATAQLAAANHELKLNRIELTAAKQQRDQAVRDHLDAKVRASDWMFTASKLEEELAAARATTERHARRIAELEQSLLTALDAARLIVHDQAMPVEPAAPSDAVMATLWRRIRTSLMELGG